MEPATLPTVNIAKQLTHLLAFLALVAILWQPIAPPALNLPVLAISSWLGIPAPAAPSLTYPVEPVWPAVTSIALVARALLAFLVYLNTMPVGLLV